MRERFVVAERKLGIAAESRCVILSVILTSAATKNVVVETGAEYSWVRSEILAEIGITPVRVERFETADGSIIERDVGFVMLYASGRSSPSIVVFGREGDMTLLGAFGLEGLNLRVDLGRRELVPAGPVPAAALRAAAA